MQIYACTPRHALPDGEARLLGAVDRVTGAMTRLDFVGARVLVDCGIPQGRDASAFRLPDEARDVDAVVLTHGHLDHTVTWITSEVFPRSSTVDTTDRFTRRSRP